MPREYAQIRTNIWSEPTIRAFTRAERDAYLVIYTQPELNRCGVIPFTLRRWAKLASDDSPAKLRKALAGLEKRNAIVVDEDTEELFLRTYVRWDGLLTQPQVVGAMVRDYRSITSQLIGDAFLAEMRRVWHLPLTDSERRGMRIALGATENDKQREAVGTGLTASLAEAIERGSVRPFDGASVQGLPEGVAKALARRSYSAPTPTPTPAPCAGPSPAPPPPGATSVELVSASPSGEAHTHLADQLLDANTRAVGAVRAKLRAELVRLIDSAPPVATEDLAQGLRDWAATPKAAPGLLPYKVHDAASRAHQVDPRFAGLIADAQAHGALG